jgi:RimJ/RimL family protein N-acetyltransferase/catechol 2,3-dioxygenase-like lactoylglutathione lyase family enzyme
MTIETENLKLIPCDIDILMDAITGNDSLAKRLGVTVADDWTEFGVGALQYSLDRLLENEKSKGWWTYFPVHIKENKLIGSGGYKGSPSSDGTVEIGYEIAPGYRNRGLATEMAKGLIENAFKDERVKLVVAHTLAQDNPSTKVLEKCGFEKVEEINDPEDGLIWKWELKRKAKISGIAPFFVVRDVPKALAFYRDRLGFEITFQGPAEDDIFFGIVQRGAAMIMLKAIGVEPIPNYTRDIKQGHAPWDAYLYVPDPDALAAEFSSRNVDFFQPLNDNDDGLRGFEVQDADGYVLYFGRPNVK